MVSALGLQRGVPVLAAGGGFVGPTIEREAWKRIRGPLLGSSDMAAILGQDEYVGAWDVFDRIMLGDWDDAEGADIRRGNRQEANARAVFCERFGLDVLPLPMVAHPRDPRLVTDVDGLILRPDTWPEAVRESPLWEAVLEQEGPGWCELKVPRVGTFYRYREEGLPRRYIIQGQHHGGATGLGWGVFAFYTPEFDDLVAFPVLQDTEFTEWLLGAAGRWYDRHIVGRARPERPAPPPARWPAKVPGEAVQRTDDGWMLQADLLVLRHYELEQAKQDYTDTEAALIALLGEKDTHVAGGGVTVTRRSTKSQTRTDNGAVRAALKLAQQAGDTEALLALDPDDEAFKYKTESSEKIEVVVRAPNPMEIMR
jgi:hypothetical protein